MHQATPFTIRRYAPGQVSAEAFNAVHALKINAFGPPANEAEARESAARRAEGEQWWVHGAWPQSDRAEPIKAFYHLLYHEDGLAAVAQTSVRTIRAPDNDLDVLTLAGVVSAPSLRGRGFGKAVILDAFARLEEEGLAHCLFQTGAARGLYEKLGAVLVDNRFVDRTGQDTEANPWSDDWVMRYPSAAVWPDGLIDLNGPGY